ncbi:LanC-like protein 2 [Gonapodya sp. JEL0774]|nr:LanC-like protein 2 [Gonapodya sp. JEL0774]
MNYLANPYLTYADSSHSLTKPFLESNRAELELELDRTANQIVSNVSPTNNHSGKRPELNAYTGTAGIALSFLRVHKALPSITFEVFGNTVSALDLARKYSTIATSYVSQSTHFASNGMSFLTSNAGVLAIASVIEYTRIATFSASGRYQPVDREVIEQHSLSLARTAVFSALEHLDPSSPSELMYGRCGFLYLLRFLTFYIGIQNIVRVLPNIAEISSSVLVSVLEDGARTRNDINVRATLDNLYAVLKETETTVSSEPAQLPKTFWTWHGKAYLGAAHGISGIIGELACWIPKEARIDAVSRAHEDASESPHMDISHSLSARVLSEVETHFSFLTCLRSSMDTFRNSTHTVLGNLPARLEDCCGMVEAKDLVQWCHGASGWVLSCLKGYEILADTKCLEEARKVADVVWERGLLKKGVGLCHGISGNAYAFLHLYWMTGEVVYLSRSLKFAQQAAKWKRMNLPSPDHPNSLFEGNAGYLSLLTDLLYTVDRCLGQLNCVGEDEQDTGETQVGLEQTGVNIDFPKVGMGFPGQMDVPGWWEMM